eukprot:s998_g3.t1
MSFGRDNEVIEVQNRARIWNECEVEILQSFCQKEGLHLVTQGHRAPPHVSHCTVAMCGATVLLDSLHDLACPSPVFGIAGVVEHVENCLGSLWTKQVLPRIVPNTHVLAPHALGVEPGCLRSQMGRLPVIHLVAGLCDSSCSLLPPRIHVLWVDLTGAVDQHPAYEARQVVHLVVSAAVLLLRDVGKTAFRGEDEPRHHLVHGSSPGVDPLRLGAVGLQVHFEQVLVVRVAHSSECDVAVREAWRAGTRQTPGNQALAVLGLQDLPHCPIACGRILRVVALQRHGDRREA